VVQVSFQLTCVPSRLLAISMIALVAILASGPEPAEARTERAYQSKRTAAKPSRPAHREPTVQPPQGPVLAVISIAKQRISVYGSNGLIAQSAVSSGQKGFPTPTGVFSVIQKNRHHRSNIYSGAPMPFMQRITWSGIALHAGVVPGYPASHGCIRLTPAFASELWGMTKMGARVVVAPEDAVAVEFKHPALPQPAMTPGPVAAAGGERAGSMMVALAASDAQPAHNEAGPPVGRLVSPFERAKEAKAQTAIDATAKVKAAKLATEASAARAAEANKAIAASRDATAVLNAARARAEAAAKAVETSKSPEATERAKAAQAVADAKVEEAAKTATEAAAIEATKTADAFAAAREAWDAESASTAATVAMKAAEKGTEPISIFISKKAGRVYIRQAWLPIHEAPATFKQADAPLGTHLFVAMEPRDEATSGMRWLAVSLPAQAQEERRGRRDDRPAAQHTQGGNQRPSAASVLERIELPEETRKLISDKLWTGASLIVSDQPISQETGKYTDFIVLTR
jgi:L,D-transpeptidase catalytic domain